MLKSTMPKKTMIAKGCPKCEQQVPVACKACPCGYSFFNAKKTTAITTTPPTTMIRVPSPGDDIRRRTQRVRREKPNYYDALEYDKQLKKVKSRNSECDDDDSRKEAKNKKRKIKKEDDDEDELINSFTVEKQAQCSIILSEINDKINSVMWKPM